MTSPYLDTPTRSLEQLRDELRAAIILLPVPTRETLDVHITQSVKLRARLAAVEAQIAARSKTA